MKKYILILALAFVGAFLYLRQSKQPPAPVPYGKRVPKTSKDLSAKPVTFLSKASTEKGIMPPECKSVWPALLNKLSESTMQDMNIFHRECFEVSKKLPPSQNVLAFCFGKDLTKKEVFDQCYYWLGIYRSYVIYEYTKDEKDLSKLDSTTLMNQLMALFGGAAGNINSKELFELIQARADLLREKEKDLYAAYKMAAMVSVIQMLNAFDDKAISSSEIHHLENSALSKVYEAQDFNVRDDELAAVNWIIAIKNNNLDLADALIDNYLQQYPDSALATYDKAHLLWKEGNTDEAIASLNQAIKLDPSNQDYKDTLAKIRTAKKDAAIWNLNMNVNFDNL